MMLPSAESIGVENHEPKPNGIGLDSISPESALGNESQCHALLRPCEWEAGVGHQLARREVDRLAAVQVRDDDVRSEKIQPHQSRRMGRPHAFLRADVFQIGGWARCETTSERMGADQEAD